MDLVGDCQGGWLATIYAALHPERINTLTIAGAPIDFRAGGATIHAYVQALGPDMGFYERVIAMGDGVLKGEYMLNGFIVIRPESEVSKQLELLAHLDDADHVERYRAFEDWFKFPQDIPGAFYLWIVEHLFRDNELVNRTLEVGGERWISGASTARSSCSGARTTTSRRPSRSSRSPITRRRLRRTSSAA